MVQTIIAAVCVGVVAVACIWGYRLDHSSGNKENTESKDNQRSQTDDTSER